MSGVVHPNLCYSAPVRENQTTINDQLLQSDASAIMSLQDAIIRYSGLTEESRRELEKNLLSQAAEASS
jgi:hypothetical protein